MFQAKFLGFDFYYIFYTFLMYSFLGWIYESCYVSIREKTVVNRGFLNGPIIPIYGAGAVTICILLNPIANNLFYVFFGGIVLATVLEYITSYLMEKLFQAKWWDYSDCRFNLQGRICLKASLFWGVLSVLMTVFIKPISNKIINKIPRKAGEMVAVILLCLITIDLSITVISTLHLNQKLAIMNRLREELIASFEHSKLYASKEELRRRIENGSIAEFYENLHLRIDESKKNKTTVVSISTELEEKLHSWKARYASHLDHIHIIQRRLLKAFPNMKSTYNNNMLSEVKERLKELKDK